MSELRSCPFCGGEAELHDGVVIIPVIDENGAYIDADVEDTPAWVECAACGAATDGVDSADEAIAAWNRRADARQLALKTGVCPMCEDCPDGCPVETPKDSRNIVTNADRIRGMSDEELSVTLMCPTEMGMAEIPCDHSDDKNCYQCLLNWLRQPAEMEGKE